MGEKAQDESQDTRPPENLAEAVGLLSTRRYYLLDFVTDLIGKHPYLVLQQIANNQGATIVIEVPGSDTARVTPSEQENDDGS